MRSAGLQTKMEKEIYTNWRLLHSNKSLLTSSILTFFLLNIKNFIAKSSLFSSRCQTTEEKKIASCHHWCPEALFYALIKCFCCSWCGHTNARVQFTRFSPQLAALCLQLLILVVKWPIMLQNIRFTNAIHSQSCRLSHTKPETAAGHFRGFVLRLDPPPWSPCSVPSSSDWSGTEQRGGFCVRFQSMQLGLRGGIYNHTSANLAC